MLHALPKGLQGALNGAPDSHHSPSSSLGRLPSAFRVPVVQVNRLIGINRRLGAGTDLIEQLIGLGQNQLIGIEPVSSCCGNLIELVLGPPITSRNRFGWGQGGSWP